MSVAPVEDRSPPEPGCSLARPVGGLARNLYFLYLASRSRRWWGLGLRHPGLGRGPLRQESDFASTTLGSMLSLSAEEHSVEPEAVVELELEVAVEADELEVMESRHGSQAKPTARKNLFSIACSGDWGAARWSLQGRT